MPRPGTYYVSFLALTVNGWEDNGDYSTSRVSRALAMEIVECNANDANMAVVVEKDCVATTYHMGRKIDHLPE